MVILYCHIELNDNLKGDKMNSFKAAVPAMTAIAIAASSKIRALSEDLAALYKEGSRTDGYVNPEIFSYDDCDFNLIDMIDAISEAEYNAQMAPEMAKAIEVLQSVKEKINKQENAFTVKKGDINKKIAKVLHKARIDFGYFIDFDNLFRIKFNVKRLNENQRQSLIEVMSENGFEAIELRDSVDQMLFAGVVEDQEKHSKLNRFIFEMLKEKVTSDRNFTGCIGCEKLHERNLISYLS